MSDWGQSRQFADGPTTSGLSLRTDIGNISRHVSKVPTGDVTNAPRPDALPKIRRDLAGCRIFIELINGPFLKEGGTPDQFRTSLARAITLG